MHEMNKSKWYISVIRVDVNFIANQTWLHVHAATDKLMR